ncbi:MAG TPA: zinc ABC transporter substrate-binding protein [Pseudomonadales bacterium]|nr:zinc ABC transporter substrate-binding protein [Pseudomonadales bacterium]HND14019.1 zinc ABC transporter substrate-binding protein [Pseudomonadales bacterium]
MPPRIVVRTAGLLLFLLASAGPVRAANAERPLVVGSIRPLYLIVLALAGDRVDTRQLLDAGSSAHDFALRPSQLRLLGDARQVFWIDPALEHPLLPLLARLPGPRRDTALLPSLGLPPRADGVVDPHVWLDPRLALALATHIERVLLERGLVREGELDIAAFAASMHETEAHMAAELAGLQNRPFAAMHDGYGYFVRRFALRAPAVLALDAEQQVGARTLARMRREVRDHAAQCLLAERSGGNRRLAQAIAAGSGIPVVELDSLAADVPAGPDAFARFLVDFARGVAGCLRGAEAGSEAR